MKNKKGLLELALEEGNGILRLCPNWVPRKYSVPGMRLKLSPNDYYSYGIERGPITERWFASNTRALEEGALQDEGLSYIYIKIGTKKVKILFKDAIELLGDRILGNKIMKRFGGWMAYAKFFDNMDPIPFHLHQNDEEASKTNQKGKSEAYFFPEQLNNHLGNFPYSFFGLNPGTTKKDIKNCLLNWGQKFPNILKYSKAYRLTLGTGWNVPSGILHSPGSLLTYELQGASDVYAIFQSFIRERKIPWDMLVKDVPEDFKNDLDYIIDLIDWDSNLDPNFYKKRFLKPKTIHSFNEMREMGYEESEIIYKSEDFSAKKLVVLPEETVKIFDRAPYGLIVIQGRGQINDLEIEAPTMITFGDMTYDECYVTFSAAKEGVIIKNESKIENLVILKHFGPEI